MHQNQQREVQLCPLQTTQVRSQRASGNQWETGQRGKKDEQRDQLVKTVIKLIAFILKQQNVNKASCM